MSEPSSTQPPLTPEAVDSCRLEVFSDGWLATFCLRLLLKNQQGAQLLAEKLTKSEVMNEYTQANSLVKVQHSEESSGLEITLKIFTQHVQYEVHGNSVVCLPIPGCLDRILSGWFGMTFLFSAKEDEQVSAKFSTTPVIPVTINTKQLYYIHDQSFSLEKSDQNVSAGNNKQVKVFLRSGAFFYNETATSNFRASAIGKDIAVSCFIFPDFHSQKAPTDGSNDSKELFLRNLANPPTPNYFKPQGPSWDKLIFINCHDQPYKPRPGPNHKQSNRGPPPQSTEINPQNDRDTGYSNNPNPVEAERLSTPDLEEWLELVHDNLLTLLQANLSQLGSFSSPNERNRQPNEGSGYEFNIVNTVSSGYVLRDTFTPCSELMKPGVVNNIEKYFETFKNMKGNSKYALVFAKILKILQDLDYEKQVANHKGVAATSSNTVLNGLWANQFDKLTHKWFYYFGIGSLARSMTQRIPERRKFIIISSHGHITDLPDLVSLLKGAINNKTVRAQDLVYWVGALEEGLQTSEHSRTPRC